MQHAVDVDGLHGRALQRGQKDAPQRVAKRHAEAALERLRHDRCDALRVSARRDLELFRSDQFLPIFLNHVITHLGRPSRDIPRIPLRQRETRLRRRAPKAPAG